MCRSAGIFSPPAHLHPSSFSDTMSSLIMKQEHSMLTLEQSSLVEALTEIEATLKASESKKLTSQKNKIQDRLNQINRRLKEINMVFQKEADALAAKEAERKAAQEEADRKKAEAEAERRARLPPEMEIHCTDCDSDFLFSGEDRQRFDENGWKYPFRCPECRQARKEARQNGEQVAERPKFDALTITCKDCQSGFEFSAESQKHFAKKGYEAPVRCEDCRKKKKDTALKPLLINCKQCHADFTFSVGAQKHHKEMNWKDPSSCPTCRKSKQQKDTRSTKRSA